MKGIYLTQEGKQEIEAKIEILEKSNAWDEIENSMIFTQCELYKDILSSATILPVEESWTNVLMKSVTNGNIIDLYPQGVIIQPKQ